MDTKKNIFLWVLYDYANSFVSIVFFLYFAQWLVIDKGVADIYFNLAFTFSAVLLLITAPVSGVYLDKSIRRITGLRYTTAFATLFYGLCALFAVNGNSVGALIFFVLGLYFYLLSFIFYTPLIADVPYSERGRVSGWGIFANYLGQISGLLIVLPLSNGSFSFFGAEPRAETLLPAVILFSLLSLPMLIFYKEQKRVSGNLSLASGVRETLKQTRILSSFSGVGLFLLSYFLFNDAVLTAANNFPIFLEQVWGVSDSVKTYIMLGILITSAIGGVISGHFADKFGHKRVLIILLFGWIIILPVLGFATNFILFIVSSTLMGFWFGAGWAVSRSVMAYLAPKGKSNLAFAYFGIAERASSLLGPIVWGGIVSSLV